MKKDPQARKQRLLDELSQVRQAVLLAAQSLPAEKQRQVFLGSWSAWELLAHLAGWDRTNVQAARSLQAGELPEFYAFKDRDWASYNALLVSRYAGLDFETLLAEVQAAHRDLLAFMSMAPAEVFDKDYGVRYKGYRVTLGRLLEAELRDERQHLEQLRGLLEGAAA